MRTLIIPDVHGRPFWRKATARWLESGEHGKIVFLGDYIDPYAYEGITDDMAIAELEDIIVLKKQHKDQVVLLQGNHDREYYSPFFHKIAGGGRYCQSRAKVITDLFLQNSDLFQLAYEEEHNGKRYLYTHAALVPDWLRIPRGMNLIDENVISADELNRLYPLSFDNDTALSSISGCRGGVDECGSILWADCREILGVGEKLPQGLYNIFGHTQLRVGAIIQDSWACLDFRQAFVLEDGVIKDY